MVHEISFHRPDMTEGGGALGSCVYSLTIRDYSHVYVGEKTGPLMCCSHPEAPSRYRYHPVLRILPPKA